jgi:hypothetical protein
MAADIKLYKADFGPVGVDQAPHIELPVKLPGPLLPLWQERAGRTPDESDRRFPKLLGIDGATKDGKSLNIISKLQPHLKNPTACHANWSPTRLASNATIRVIRMLQCIYHAQIFHLPKRSNGKH